MMWFNPAQAQTLDSFLKTNKSALNNNFNIGLSSNIQNPAPFHFYPAVKARVGRLQVAGFYSQKKNDDLLKKLEIDLDLFPFHTNESTKYYLKTTFDATLVRMMAQQTTFDNHFTHAFGMGVSRYKLNSRHQFSAKMGVAFDWQRPILWRSPVVGQSSYPFFKISYDLYIFKLQKPFYEGLELKSDHPITLGVLNFLGKNFNPSAGVGFGGGHLFHVAPNIGCSVGRFYFRGFTLDNYQNKIGFGTDFQIGLNIFRLDIHPAYKTYFTASFDNFYYDNYSVRDDYFYLWQIGLNHYKINGYHSINTKIGIALESIPGLAALKFSNSFTPYGELSYNVHIFKFRDLNMEEIRSIQTKDTTENAVYHNHNPFFNLGASTVPDIGIFSSIGFSFNRITTGVRVGYFDGDLAAGLFGDVDIYKIKKRTSYRYYTAGVSTIGSINFIPGINIGYKRYFEKKADSIKVGIGLLNNKTVIPTFEANAFFYAFKFNFSKPKTNQ